MAKAQLEARIKNLGNIYRVIAPRDEAMEALERKGIEWPISARDIVYARMQREIGHSLSSYGTWIREGVLYVPRGIVLFIRDSPLWEKINLKESTRILGNGQNFYLNSGKYLKQAEEDKSKEPENRRVLAIPRKWSPETWGSRHPSRYNLKVGFEIPANAFNEEELTLWLFRNQAEAYGKFLHDMSILWEMEVALIDYGCVDEKRKSFARPLWFGHSGNCFSLSGCYQCLPWQEESLRGLLKKTNNPLI